MNVVAPSLLSAGVEISLFTNYRVLNHGNCQAEAVLSALSGGLLGQTHAHYKEKVSMCDGVDPYTCAGTDTTADVKLLPVTTHADKQRVASQNEGLLTGSSQLLHEWPSEQHDGNEASPQVCHHVE